MASPANIDLSGLNGADGFRLNGETTLDQSGWSVASAGDVNGDGFGDVIVGAPFSDASGTDSGASYVVFGRATGFAANLNLASLDGSNGFKLAGVSPSDRTGFSVASAGDVNGDGYDDLIVGASYADAGGFRSGASYVVFGTAFSFAASIDVSTLNGSNGFRMSGSATDFSGWSVASAGDVNGDGFDDLIVGVPYTDANGVDAGATYVVFGQASGFTASIDLSGLNGSKGFRLVGGAADDRSGWSVASAGDVNGDGYDDVIVTSPYANSSGTSYVVFGKASGFAASLNLSTLNGTTGFRLTGEASNDRSGWSVASAGDVNGDGYDDLIVGAKFADPNGPSSGASYVVFGKGAGFGADFLLSSLDGSNGFSLNGGSSGDNSGWSVSSAGDVNGDGYDDLIVGALRSDANGTDSGASYVVFGKASGFAADLNLAGLDGMSGFRLTGAVAGDQSGTAVASAGDVNGDGYDDLIVGAPRNDANGTDSGASYVVFGGAFGETVTTNGTSAAEMLIGGSVADVLTGGGGADVFHAGAGDDRLVVSDLTFRLADGGTGTDTLALDGADLKLDLTQPLTAGKLEGIERIDLAGTGNNTLVVNKASILGGIGVTAGGAHVLTVEGNAGDTVQFAELGWRNVGAVSDAGTIYGRYVLGDAEVRVEQGLSLSSAPMANTVRVATLDGVSGFTLTGATGGERSGWSVASAGDVNGDGFDDLIVGAPESGAGASYVVFGQASGFATIINLASLDGSNGFKLAGATAFGSGWSVSSAGDVNGDGYDDMIVGAPYAEFNNYYVGAGYVVFGKASGFAASIDLSTLNGSNGFSLRGSGLDRAGWSVASAGDVNGDGFDDLIISSPFDDAYANNAGASYVVFGQESGFAASIDLWGLNGNNGFRLLGSAYEFSGLSVASAGDVNGDGYDDLIVGTFFPGSSGTSYVVFGKASGFGHDLNLASLDGISGFRLTGTAADQGGRSVASAGDVNGDGYDDLIVGARSRGTNGIDVDVSYVVFGKASGFVNDFVLSSLDGSDGFRLTGAGSWSVGSAGDINGDGYDDLIVGAPYAFSDAALSGATYIVFGKASGFTADLNIASLNGVSGFRLAGAGAGDRSGRSVASAGDVNGDGYDDLIVGAPLSDANGTDSGASYVVFGGAFGGTVTTNGTAAAEMLIGGSVADVLTGGGGADVFHAGAGDDRLVVSDLTFRLADGGTGTDTLALDGAGLTLDLTQPLTAGKLEGIERIDLTGTGNNTLVVNKASVLGGIGATAGGAHVLTIEGDAGDTVQFAELGWRSLGTVSDAGTTYTRYGLGDAEVRVEQGLNLSFPPMVNLATLDGVSGFKLSGAVASDRSGFSVASAGDVNGDGFDDVIVGAPYSYANGFNSGASYVVFGQVSGFAANIDLASLDGSNGFRLAGESQIDQSGFSVASAGDVNGDGFDDVIVGARYDVAHGFLSGASYVVFGQASGFAASMDLSTLDGSNGFRVNGRGYDFSGWSVASAGDVNGDGYDDLIIGAPYAAANGVDSGASYVVFGQASGFAASIDLSGVDGTNGFRMFGSGFGRSGWSVASAGDVNGDGYDDLIVGAVYAMSSGVSYVVFGKASGFTADLNLSTLNGATGFRLRGEASSDRSGWSVASAGDVNGDGYDDLIVGAKSADPNGSNSGASYVVFGKASGFAADFLLSSLNGSNGFSLNGAAALDQSGWSVSSAGDVNGDGYDDLIVGTPYADANGANAGATYIVFGKASGFTADLNLASLDGSSGFRLIGAAASDQSGWSVASAGDVNGDGYDDLIVGAPRNDANGTDSGASYIVFGGAFNGTVTTNGTAAAEILIGGAAADVLTGGGGADVFHAGAGNDRIAVRDTNFRLVDGGTGIDTLAFDGAGLTLDLSRPLTAAKLEGIERIDLTGTGNNDLRISQAAVLGGIGEVVGGKHILTVLGGRGDTVRFFDAQWLKTGSFSNPDGTFDRYEFGNAVVDVEQGIGIPIVTVRGTSGDDTVTVNLTVPGQPTATYRDDVLNGYNGNDILDGGLGADTMNGGKGNDTYYVDNAGDVVIEVQGGGRDEIRTLVDYTLLDSTKVEVLRALGTTGLTFMANNAGVYMIGAGGDDTLVGGSGNDQLDGGAGADTMEGGAGNDTYTVDNAGDEVMDTAGIDTIHTSVNFTLLAGQAIEYLRVSDGVVTGLTLTGNALDNQLFGGAGRDTLVAGGGNDRLDGGGGADTMEGGAGNDTYYVDHPADFVIDESGIDIIRTSVSYALAAGQEIEEIYVSGTAGLALTGNELANKLFGGIGGDTLVGGAGNDKLYGRAGADIMIGGAGSDAYSVDNVGDVVVELAGSDSGIDTVTTVLSSYALGANVENLEFAGTGGFTGTGNELANRLTGGAANDVLIGGRGADILSGGAGADVFVFRDALDSTRAARDTITDFTVGQDGIDFTQLSSGGSFHALHTVTSVPATIGAHSLVAFVASGGNTVLYVNDTGTAQATAHASMEILLKGVTTLGDADLGYILI